MAGTNTKSDFDVIVVGGGFCGVWALHKLRKLDFNVRLFEAGSALGGIWHWNCYPGARVDTDVPAYQFSDAETWESWEWTQRFPGQPELAAYFQHLDKVWDLSKDVSYSSRVTSLTWDNDKSNWKFQVNHEEETKTANAVVLCTGFASKRFIPDYAGMSDFKGVLVHTSVWPQTNVDLKGKKVAVIGTGASGIQVIQDTSKEAGHLTVFQRTPNFALPMRNDPMDLEDNKTYRTKYAEYRKVFDASAGGTPFVSPAEGAFELSKEQRVEVYEKLYNHGSLAYWVGNFRELMVDATLNEEVYQFWRSKTLPRIDSQRNRDILAPEKKPHPYGTKRVSLEQKFYEVFNQPNVHLISTREEPIERFTANGIQTKNAHYDFDVVILATGFDSITGGITQIPIVGTDPNLTITENWQGGTRTYLGMTSHGFPNLFFTYGPQAPTAFATGPACAETQGKWIVECLRYSREHGLSSVEAERSAEEDWGKHVNEIADMTLLPLADSWYFGANVPGKKRESLNYIAGLPVYKEKLWNCVKDGYAGFLLK